MAQPVDWQSYALVLEYDKNMVSERVQSQINEIILRCAKEIVSKGALLANPDVLTVEAKQWDAAKATMVDMDLEDNAQ